MSDKVSPESVNFGAALGMSRCGICRHYVPSPDNAMTGSCSVVDKYRVERNQWCERFEPSNPTPAGEHGGTVARAAEQFLAEVRKHQFLAEVPHVRDDSMPGMLLTGKQWRGYDAQFEPTEAEILMTRSAFVHGLYAHRLANMGVRCGG